MTECVDERRGGQRGGSSQGRRGLDVEGGEIRGFAGAA